MMTTQNSVMFLEIAKAIARTGTTALDPAASTFISNGEIVVLDLDGTILDSTTVVGKQRIRVAQSQGASLPLIQSPEIDLKGVKSYRGKAYTAPTVQIDYIGYNSVTNAGDIDVIASNGYEIMVHDINSAAYGSTGVDKFGFFVSDSSATKSEIADGLAISMQQNTVRLTRKPFIVERVSSVTTVTGILGTATTWTVTNGSTTVIANGTVTNVSVGNYVRLGGLTDSEGIYKITAIVSGASSTIILDMPFQLASAVLTELTAVEVFTDAQIVAGSVGIRLTGLAPVFVAPQSTEYYVNRWSTNLRNSGSTTVTNAQGATEGVGSYAAVASLEYFLVGNEGFISRNDIPFVSSRANTISTDTYGFISLEWDSVKSGHIFNQEAASKQLLIAFASGGSREQLTGVVTSVQTVLNAWLSASFPALTLV